MPYVRPGASVYVTNTTGGVLLHDQAVYQAVGAGCEVGIAIKQKPAHWSDGLAAQNQIQEGEPYLINRHGIVQVPDGGVGFADGDTMYITTGSVLQKTNTGTGTVKFGRVVEIPHDGRGVPTGFVRVNMDERNSFV
jgi:hypothetical protein